MNGNLKTTLKAWPAIAAATIGLCFLTKTAAGWWGVELPDQQNVEIVRQFMLHAFDSFLNFKACAFLLLQVLVVLPAAEEAYFRHFFYRRQLEPLSRKGLAVSLAPSLAIAGFGACLQAGAFGSKPCDWVVSEFPDSPWLAFWTTLSAVIAVEYAVRTFACRLAAKISPWLSIAISSALFSAAHYIAQPFPDAAFLALFFFGAAQCRLYARTGRIWCAMLNHFLFNLTNLVLLFALPQQ